MASQALDRNELIIARNCLKSEIERVEDFIANHGGPDNSLNSPHLTWLEIARSAKAKLDEGVSQ